MLLLIIDGAHQCLDAGHDDIGIGTRTIHNGTASLQAHGNLACESLPRVMAFTE